MLDAIPASSSPKLGPRGVNKTQTAARQSCLSLDICKILSGQAATTNGWQMKAASTIFRRSGMAYAAFALREVPDLSPGQLAREFGRN
jgi:hypothetical protein